MIGRDDNGAPNTDLDSFVIHICTEGEAIYQYNQEEYFISKGECILFPASIQKFEIIPESECELLEVYI